MTIRFLPLLSSAPLLVTLLSAQTQILRGKIEDVPSTVNQFVLDGTTLPLVSTVLNLNAWVGQDARMDVVNIGTATAPVLRVDVAVATPAAFELSPLHIGQSTTLKAHAPTGSVAFLLVDFSSNVGFAPVPAFGVWLLGASPFLLATVLTNGQNEATAMFPTPANAALVGLTLSAQALIGDHGNWFFSNLDTETIQP